MKIEPIEHPTSMNGDDMLDRCRRATKILVTHETRRAFPTGEAAINAAAIMPEPPVTRAAATPHILLIGPFRDEPDLYAVAVYVGIGTIEVRNIGEVMASYTLSPIDGDGMETRDAYLQAAFKLYFDDVTVIPKASS